MRSSHAHRALFAAPPELPLTIETAVVARKGPLVGKTAAEVGFRTRYGAAVIAVHRDGTRVQDLPGNIKLHAGDVLLLEAGPTFISRNTDNQKSFALISEVKDSKPPRLSLLIPAVLLVLAMLVIVTLGQGVSVRDLGFLPFLLIINSSIILTYLFSSSPTKICRLSLFAALLQLSSWYA